MTIEEEHPLLFIYFQVFETVGRHGLFSFRVQISENWSMDFNSFTTDNCA